MQLGNRKIHTFFLEFIIVTILFVLTTTVLVVAFMKANTLSEHSQNKLFAMQRSISLLEDKKQVVSNEEAVYLYAYDEGWEPVTVGGCYHIVVEETLIPQEQGVMKQLALRSYQIEDDETLFETTVTTYLPDYVLEEGEVRSGAE